MIVFDLSNVMVVLSLLLNLPLRFIVPVLGSLIPLSIALLTIGRLVQSNGVILFIKTSCIRSALIPTHKTVGSFANRWKDFVFYQHDCE